MSRTRTKIVLTVGAANAEHILSADAIELGKKHIIKLPAQTRAGGSAVNHACRLLAYGALAFPIVPLGGDSVGRDVSEAMQAAAAHGFGRRSSALRKWLRTITKPSCSSTKTTILLEQPGNRRTSFSEPGTASRVFRQTCKKALAALKPYEVSAVVIGHVHSDEQDDLAATQMIVDRFVETIPIVANLGHSQYGAGPTNAKLLQILQRVDLCQLAIKEAQEFLKDRVSGLRGLLEWFVDQRINALITMDRFGALGVLGKNEAGKHSDRFVLAWPYEFGKGFIDPTGAGDAMAAALALAMVQNRGSHWDNVAFKTALDDARYWAAYACTRFGGAAGCPNRKELEAFKKASSPGRSVEDIARDDRVLSLLERAFAG